MKKYLIDLSIACGAFTLEEALAELRIQYDGCVTRDALLHLLILDYDFNCDEDGYWSYRGYN